MDDIFNLIKLKDFKKLKEIIIKETNIDLNIHDEQNNYLLHHILINNQNDILELLLKKNIRLDILDLDGRTILYIPIKYNFIESFKLLLQYNKEIIGISIIDIKDNIGYTALHYCILLNNLEFLKLLLKYNADPLIKDNNENNILELALKNEKDDILIYLIDNINLHFLSNNNETLLQYALSLQNIKIINILLNKDINLNNQEKEYGLSALHQSIIINNISITDKLIKNGANINLQDFYGNTPLMYAINENNKELIMLFINYDHLNYNLTNIYGETSLHIILKKMDENIEGIDKFIKYSDLSIQDNDGNTCLMLLKDFSKFKNILENKELNIFIKNNNNECVYDLINKDIKQSEISDDKINIIINSFYNSLQINKEKLIIDWEIECLNKILNETECKKKIKNVIINENRSIPKIKDYNLIFDHGIFVNTCYYTGAPIDILFGLLYLYNKFKTDELNIIIDYPLTNNSELELYFKSLGINYNYKLDFCNFEINWSYQTLIFPTYFNNEFKNKIKKYNYIVIPIGIETSFGSHANILFYDIQNSLIERFEPNGANYPSGFNYNPKLLDSLLEKKFKSFDSNIIYLKPNEYLPTIGFQMLENINNNTCKRIGDPNGFCGVWCIWWIYHKMKNIKIKSKELAEKLIKEIKFKNISFKTIIRNFSKNISDLRDEFFKKYKLDINDFMVDNYNHNILNKLEKDIINYLE